MAHFKPAGVLARLFQGVVRTVVRAFSDGDVVAPSLTADGALQVGPNASGTPIPVTVGAPAAGTYSRAVINQAGAGDTVVIAAVANKRIRIFHVNLVIGGNTTLTLKYGAAGDPISGPYGLVAQQGLAFDAPGGDVTIDAAAVNTGFIVNSSAAVQVSGFVLYTQS